ncbi:hypothetical protein [Rosistilla oblonga]
MVATVVALSLPKLLSKLHLTSDLLVAVADLERPVRDSELLQS